MAEVVAEGEVILRARENVREELAKAEAAFERTMKKLDGQEAELKIQADMLDFDRKAKEAQAEIARLDKKKATVTIDADTKKIDEAIAKEQANLKKLELANVRLNNRQRKLAEERAAANDKLYNQMEKGEKHVADVADRESKRAADAHKKAIDSVTKADQAAVRGRIKAASDEATAKTREAQRAASEAEKAQKFITKAQSREVNLRIRDSIREADGRIRDSTREAAAREKIQGSEARLERQYIDLRKKRQRLEQAQGKTFLPTNERTLIGFDIRGVDEQIAEVRAKLALIGKPPPEVDIHLNMDNRAADSLNRWISAISTTTVRLGPFTTTIAGAARALALLGPIITGVVGSIGALAGAAGSAALGFGGALTAGVGAFGLVLGSTAGLLPGLLRDFKNLNTLQDAYHKQVLKTGAGSDKAKTKLKEFNHALGEVSPSARQAFDSFDKLQTSYRGLAQQARTPFLSAMNEGFKTANTLISRFGPEALQSFGIVSRGVKAVARALRGPEATGIIGTLFDSGQKALPAFGRGLGNLASSAARVAAAFSRMLAPLGSGFEKWTQRFSDFTKDSSKLNRFVDNTTKSMRSFGHLLQSTGGFLATFFGAGVGPGVQLVDRLSAGIDKITNSIRANPKGLGDFFAESVGTAEKLYGVLQPLASLFMEWATILRPFSNLILAVSGSIASLVASLAGFGPTRGLITAAFSIFLAGTLVSKIRNVTQAVATLAASLGALGAKQAALRTGSALTGGALAGLGRNAAIGARGVTAAEAGLTAAAARGAAPVRATSRVNPTIGPAIPVGAAANAEKTAASTAKLAGAATKGARSLGALKVGLTGVGAVLGIANPAFGAAALAVTGAAVAYTYFKHRNDDVKKAIGETAAATDRTAAAYRANSGALADTASQSERANLVVRQARRDLDHAKKGTDDYKLAQLNLKDALRARGQNEQAVQANLKENSRLGKEQVTRVNDQIKAFDKLNKSKMDDYRNDIKNRKGTMYAGSIDDIKDKQELAALDAKRTKLLDQQTAALNRNAAVQANNARGLAGLSAATGKAEQQLGQFARTADHASAKKIAVKFQDSGDAGRVAAAAGRAIKAGVPSKVATRVAVSTSDAETSIKRLNATRLTPKRLSIVEQGGAKAIATVQHLTGLKLTDKQQNIISKGGPKAIAELGHLLGIKLTDKQQRTTESGAAAVIQRMAQINGIKLNTKQAKAILNDLASGKAHSIAGAIAAIPGSKTSTITTVYREVHVGKNLGSHRAQGGVFAAATGKAGASTRIAGESYSSPALERTISAAFKQTANIAANRKSYGERVSKPKLLVGEQRGHPEYVIATNPAFRKRNQGLLASAAKRLGMGVTAAASGFGPTMGSLGGAGYTPSFGIDKAPPGPGKAPKTKKGFVTNYTKKGARKRLKSGRDWANYVNGLTVQQGDLEREVGIRESQVNEPEELLVEVGRITGKDPQTGKDVDLGPQMAPNQPQIDAYKTQLKSVLDAMDALINVIQTIIQAIPQAINAINIEDMYRKTNEHNLNDAISHEKSIIANHSKGKQTAKDKATVASFKTKLARDEKRLDFEKKARDQIKEDRTTLTDGYKEAGFDLREARIARDSTNADYMGIQGKATTQAAAENKQTTGDGTGGSGGTGGSSDSGPTLAQQTGLADTERANILKQFGGNTLGLSATGAVGAAGGGAQRNAANVSPNAGAGTIDPQAGGSSAGSFAVGNGGAKSVAAAFAGGAAAAGVLGAAGAAGGAAATSSLGGGSVTNNTITNNFAAPPPDAHTWTKGLEFEVGAIL